MQLTLFDPPAAPALKLDWRTRRYLEGFEEPETDLAEWWTSRKLWRALDEYRKESREGKASPQRTNEGHR